MSKQIDNIDGQSLSEKWGSYGPETRKSLFEVEQFIGINAAKRLASAIDAEYRRRIGKLYGDLIVYKCKGCNKEFRRQKWSPRSKEYCNKCTSKAQPNKKKMKTRISILTWEQVDEIRSLRKTTHMTKYALAMRYGVSEGAISSILDYRSWKPEDDPRVEHFD